MRRLLPLVGAFYALLAAHPASAEATGRVFTCQESDVSSWQMTQPQEHADAGLWPRWSDCLAWRDGDPGPSYVWSYGLTTPTTTEAATTTTEATTTTTEATTTTTTTEPPPPSTDPLPTTTTSSQPPETTSTTTTSTTEAPIQTVASTSSTSLPNITDNTTEAIATDNTESTTTSSTTSTSIPQIKLTPKTVPATRQGSQRSGGLAPGASNGLAPGVTPEAQRAIVAASLGLITSSVAASRRRT